MDTDDPESFDSETIARHVSVPPAADGERFAPGEVLDKRYRIISLLGRGGMGEVYRAEDLKLGQQVALKFLPRNALSGPAIERLYAEVRLGRKVSHPNVCRLYDVGEWNGNHFVTMEYIDGEDLASLLRRIGKLPEDKGIELIQEICAGLAAAHGLGVIHRDLKPANIMIDGRGNAVITDFGLAGLAEDFAERVEIAGTPAYMAPEQLSDGKASHKSDLYALGLIMYEIFTGQRRFDGRSIDDVRRLHSSTDPVSVSRQVSAIDPIVRQVIARCLEPDPAERPRSIHSVIAALPGADPLQAALDAGETPSPEMVAAAGKTGDLSPTFAAALVALAIVMMAGIIWLKEHTEVYGVRELSRHPQVLENEAREILATIGFKGEAKDTHYYFLVQEVDFRHATKASAGSDPATIYPAPINFVYRQSPEPLVPLAGSGGDKRILPTDPPNTLPGMARVHLSPEGVLKHILIVPDASYVSAFGSASDASSDGRWKDLFELANLDWSSAEPVGPTRPSPVATDAQFAWKARAEGQKFELTVNGGSLGNRVVWFSVNSPWEEETFSGTDWLATPNPSASRGEDMVAILIAIVFISSLFVARRNVIRGRADKRGAIRIFLFIALTFSVAYLLRADFGGPFYHVWDGSAELVGLAIYRAMIIATMYLAIEPYLRREWPELLISWSRFLAGGWRDALVARTVLLGVVAGLLISLMLPVSNFFTRTLSPGGFQSTLTSLEQAVAVTIESFVSGVLPGVGLTAILVGIAAIVRRRVPGAIILFLLVLLIGIANKPDPAGIVNSALFALVVAVVHYRLGLLGAVVMWGTSYLTALPLTLDTKAFYFPTSIPVFLLIGAILAWSCYTVTRFAGPVRDPFASSEA